MKRTWTWTVAAIGLLGATATVASADDLVLYPSPPVVQRMTYYGAPAVVAQPTTSYYAPAPTTAYYAPAPTPVTTYYAPAPVVSAPVPVTTYYAPAPVVVGRPVVSYYAPAAVPVTTYYAPAPVTTYYAPAVVAPVGVVRSKVYYPGEPVRNFFKAVTW
jgi:hypothetical protein